MVSKAGHGSVFVEATDPIAALTYSPALWGEAVVCPLQFHQFIIS